MPTDTAPIQTTATVITSGAEAIRTAREFAASIADGVIERDRSGPVPARELAALDASGLLAITVPRKYHGAEVPATVLEAPQQFGARAQLVHAAIEVGIARGALRDAGEFVRTRARPFFEAARAGWAPTAREDPHTIQRYGQLATRVHAAEALLAAAAATLDEVTRTPRNAAAAARGSLAVAQAKAFGSEVAAEVASDMFSLSGASAADERYDLSRHWRNARTHASHDPVAWKYHHVGNYLLNDVLPPNHGQI